MKYSFLDKIKSFSIEKFGISFKLPKGILNLYILDENLIRVRFTTKNKFEKDFSYAVIKNYENINFDVIDKKDSLEIITKKLKIIISKIKFNLIFIDLEKNEIISQDDEIFSIGYCGEEIQAFKKINGNEKFFGLGEKTGNLDKKGSFYKMWNTDFPFYNSRQDPLYVSIPFFIGINNNKTYGYFLDNTSETFFNMGASQNRYYSFGVKNGELNYYFFYDNNISKIVEKYTELTGRSEMPPIWSLGYQQCRWSYFPDKNVLNIAKTFREKDIPLDVIYLDIDWMNDYRVFDWSKNNFPNPKKMLKELNDINVKTAIILDPAVKADNIYHACKSGLKGSHFVKFPDRSLYQGEVWAGCSYFPDFTRDQTRKWWAKEVLKLKKQGVSGFWNDMNEPSVWGQAFPDIVEFDYDSLKKNHKFAHNIYGMQMARASFEGSLLDNKRSLIVTRAGYAGVQRYSSIWTGDNQSIEEDLLLNTIMIQNLSLSGVSFVGNDVGGFCGEPSKELFAKWIQLGVFTPFFRNHSMKNTKAQEPWVFGEEVEENVKEYIKLRYKLLPYIYSCFYESHIKGTPIIKPLFWFNQNDEKTYNYPYQFYFGNNILVALNKPNQDYLKVYLPEGKWVDFYTNKVYDGENEIIVECGWKKLPFFIKYNTIIPMIESKNYSSIEHFEKININCYLENNSVSEAFLLYEDDGLTYNYKNKDFLEIKIIAKKKSNKINLAINNKKNYVSKIKEFNIVDCLKK
ncbi:MAG: glycoside hydrolase family 31 protein [Candidatus Sericytochromatia bacterium]